MLAVNASAIYEYVQICVYKCVMCCRYFQNAYYFLAYFHVQQWRGRWWSYRQEGVRLLFKICKHDATDYFKDTSRQISNQVSSDKK